MAAPGPFVFYAENIPAERMNDLLTATVKVALVTSGYVPDASETGHNEFADIGANEIAAGNGYAAGGAALAGKALVDIALGSKFGSNNVSWTAAGGAIPAWRYAVFYVDGALWGLASPLLGYFVGDSAPADVPALADGNTLQLQCPAAGWFDKVRV